MASADPLELSRRLLRAVRRGDATGQLETLLADVPSERLADALDGDDERRAFWLNVHNASVGRLLLDDPGAVRTRRFAGRTRIPVAGEWLSLDDVFHGLLRRSRWKYGLGYLRRPFVDAFERIHRVETRDWRVHFARTRGTVDSPRVVAYEPSRVDEQLDEVAREYLVERVSYDPGRERVRLPRQFLLFRGDFGGRAGVLSVLRSFDLVPEDASPRFRYASADRRLDPGQWFDDERGRRG
jgi:hypothetical protein